MLSKIHELTGQSFKKEKQVFFVKSVENDCDTVLIDTDRKLIVIYDNDLAIEKFLNEIEIIHPSEVNDSNNKIERFQEFDDAEEKNELIAVETVSVISHNQKIANSLMSVFDQLNDNPSEELFKKAKAMTDVANTVIGVQLAEIKFLTLKK